MPKKHKEKRGPKQEEAKAIIALRDKLIEEGKDAEKVGLACKGMYKCDKLADKKCLDKIMSNLQAIKKGGSRSRSRSRSRPKTKK